MEKITSFTINHLKLEPGVYVSRKDKYGDAVITTFDLRMTTPNKEPVMNTAEVHTIEHLGATYLRNDPEFADKTVYFGPMGCRTGFYMLLAGDYSSKDVVPLVTKMFEFIRDFRGEVPGAAPRDCGNYLDQNLRTNFSRAYEKYRETPELYLAFEKEGKIKLSDSEHELMKKWQQRNELRKKLRDCETRDEAMAINEQMEKTCSNKEINAFADREDIMKVYKEFSPKPYMIQNTVIDSLYSDQHLRDLCRTVILYQELTYNKELKEGYSSVLNAIKDSELKQKVIDLQNHYTELAKQNEEAVKKVGTVEGYFCAKAAYEMSRKYNVPMPITEQCYRVLYEGYDPHVAIRSLMDRPKRSENESEIMKI